MTRYGSHGWEEQMFNGFLNEGYRAHIRKSIIIFISIILMDLRDTHLPYSITWKNEQRPIFS